MTANSWTTTTSTATAGNGGMLCMIGTDTSSINI